MSSTFLMKSRNTYTKIVKNLVAVRSLHVHEYISMELMNKYNIVTPKGYTASTPEEVESIFSNKMNKPGEPVKAVTLKSQVLSGGRGLGTFSNGFQGGVHMVE